MNGTIEEVFLLAFWRVCVLAWLWRLELDKMAKTGYHYGK
jgi:hypothetical protein